MARERELHRVAATRNIKRHPLPCALSSPLLKEALTVLTPGKVLYSRVTRALYAPRDPVPYLVYGTYNRTNNAHHLYAFAYRRSSSPLVLADSANSTDHCRRQVSVPLSFANPVMYYAGHIRSSIIRNEYAPSGTSSEMWRTRSIGEGSLCQSVRQINFSLPSAYAGRHEEVALALTCFH